MFDQYDAVLTPAAPGEAPHGLGATGKPIFNGLWTLMGVPAISLPLLAGEQGLPVGVQLIARRRDDGRLLRTARWLVRHLEGHGRPGERHQPISDAASGQRHRHAHNGISS